MRSDTDEWSKKQVRVAQQIQHFFIYEKGTVAIIATFDG
jgi:hypothetical protein